MLWEEGKVNKLTVNIYPWGAEMWHFGSERSVRNLCSVQNEAQFILYNEVKTDINVLRDGDNDSHWTSSARDHSFLAYSRLFVLLSRKMLRHAQKFDCIRVNVTQ